MASYLLGSTIAPGAGEMAKYYYAGTASLSPEARHERELARAVAEGFLDFDGAVAAVAQPAGSEPRPRDLLHTMARAVAKGFIDLEMAADAIAESDTKAEHGAKDEWLGRLFATGELRAADLEPLWYETEGRRPADAGVPADELYAARDAFIERVLAAAQEYSDREETARERAEDRLFEAIDAYDAAADRQEQAIQARLHAAVDAYRRGASAEPTIALLRRDTDPALAERLAMDMHRAPNADELAHLLGGLRADGKAIEGASKSKKIGFVDLCWSADKSMSLAWAFAPTQAERDAIVQAHRDAVATVMQTVLAELGWARKGAGGRGGADAGHTTWVQFDHYTARPTLEVAVGDHTELVQMPVAADPNLHSHVTMLNVVLTDAGRVGSLDLKRMGGKVHEWGALYQAHLAQNLRKLGADVVLDQETGAARLAAIPERVRDQFSKRTLSAEAIAKKWAAERGQDWNSMSPTDKIELAHRGAIKSRRSKDSTEEQGDIAAWREQVGRLVGSTRAHSLPAGSHQNSVGRKGARSLSPPPCRSSRRCLPAPP